MRYFNSLGICLCSFLYLTGFYGCFQAEIPTPSPESDQGLLTEYVDTRIGTGGMFVASGHTSPAVSKPFGMVRVGPDTSSIVSTSSSGYFYGDTNIIGISHTRYSGTGAYEGGNFRITPSHYPITSQDQFHKHTLHFNHQQEVARPGYYSVNMWRQKELPIRAELTSTLRTGIHRYTFSNSTNKHLVLHFTSQLSRSGSCESTEVEFDLSNRFITGKTKLMGDFSSRYDGLNVYFAIQLDSPFSYTVFDENGALGSDAFYAKEEGELYTAIQLHSPASPTTVVKVGISYVSKEGAMTNLLTESRNKSFTQVKQENEVAWNEYLSRIKVQGGTQQQKATFYTSIYHSLIMPTLFDDKDPNGHSRYYLGFDKEIHRLEEGKYYTDLSIWDTFRTVHPLYNLIARAEQLDIVRSILQMGKQGGVLPRWVAGGGYAGSMVGIGSASIITESYLKGLTDFDVDLAKDLMIHSTTVNKDSMSHSFCLDHYVERGYCPSDVGHKGSVSLTLEYSYADDSVFRFLEAAEFPVKQGNQDYSKRRKNFLNTWREDIKFFWPRKSDEQFLEGNSSANSYLGGDIGNSYVEGGPHHWRWYVPYAPEDLVSLFDSKKEFVDQLNAFFERSSDATVGVYYPGDGYWHGNEPDIHAAYIFNFADRPDLTQKWVKWIMNTKYSTLSSGINGDDDAGTLSAWYTFSSLGFYPLAGTDRYVVGWPLFPEASMILGDKVLNITSENYHQSHSVVAVEINGKRLKYPWFNHNQIADGGTLKFIFADKKGQPFQWEASQ